MHVFLKPTSWVYSISWVTSTTVAELPYYKVVRFFYGVKEVKGRHYVLLPLAAVICHSNFFNTLPLRRVLEKVPAEKFRSVCMECHHFNAARNGLQNGGTTDVGSSSKN
jgi:hypothetical protein